MDNRKEIDKIVIIYEMIIVIDEYLSKKLELKDNDTVKVIEFYGNNFELLLQKVKDDDKITIDEIKEMVRK